MQKACKSCRSRQELSNEYLLAKYGVDAGNLARASGVARRLATQQIGGVSVPGMRTSVWLKEAAQR